MKNKEKQRCTIFVQIKLFFGKEDPVDIRSIKQFAEEQNVSYEAIRKQIVKYSDELKDHIVRKNRTQYLDEWAINFLKEKRKENPIVLMSVDQNQEIEELKAQVDLLKSKLLVAQDQIISLQDETKKAIESQIKYTALLEESKEKDEKLKDAERRVVASEEELLHIREDNRRTIEEKDDQIQTIQTEMEDLRKTIEDLQKERDDARTEAQSFTRSIFGFYRKK